MPAALTSLQAEVLELLAYGYSVPEITQRKGFTRQRTQEIVDILRAKGLLTNDPAPATTTHVTPWPPAPRYARWGPFVLRSALLPREDGAELPDAAPNELALVWTHSGWPPRYGWSQTVQRRRRWAVADTRTMYADWWLWIDHLNRDVDPDHDYALPLLTDNTLRELTRNIAWVLDTESVLLLPDSAAATPG
jgi:hypothetical protein